jgi:hypothetical protein
MVDMTHHQFLCRRCSRAERHERCHIREITAAFSPSEKRIVAFMLRNCAPPAGAAAQQNPAAVRQQISLPSVGRAAGPLTGSSQSGPAGRQRAVELIPGFEMDPLDGSALV